MLFNFFRTAVRFSNLSRERKINKTNNKWTLPFQIKPLNDFRRAQRSSI
ncbi:MAG: hypothetical protein ACTS6G_03815 [Candidatus Hodgkinia cicadicola]